ncbi:M20/M25/M40 family metallo-hydrolase [Massilia sp. IC2-278]|uniref:M20/M25/M40 family metallo-hydrolase n=1 Tax=Massilia sp. IC2-278 TaxID=2887200 RepID=UPI001E2A1145|nr:M20/M25/M40 family metallo-hydrolase [Massilia sp. IC2-278]MCC2959169.1 M20/M25/M40 family metallo-hydrolase [Massilia sp. IC2-278]
MNRRTRLPALGLMAALFASSFSAPFATSAQAASPGNDPAALAKIRDAAMTSDYAWERTADMTDLIGPRLSGSAGAAAAVNQVADAMRKLGAKVTLQPVKVPHWVRGAETGELVDYKGRPDGITQRVVLTALGGSGATPNEGLVAPVIVVSSFDELKARAAEVKGRIVLFDVPFDQHMADRGLAGPAYGQGSNFRTNGPRMAAEMGAAAALVRSVGGANYRLPHTGNTALQDGARIPAAAVSVEDAMLMRRLAERGPLRMRLLLTPKILPDADSFNVIADFPGTDKPDEVVIVSGHLDSWDLATGAHDDAAGVASAMAVFDVLKKLDYRPRRTIRLIAWMNEENGTRGARTYLEAQQANAGSHVGAIESDNGVGRPFGMRASVPAASTRLFAPLQAALLPIGAAVFQRQDALSTGDLSGLERAGVPSFAPLVDTSAYFDYHHTAADTLDKVDPDNLRRNVAVMTATAWFLANVEEPIGRANVPAK